METSSTPKDVPLRIAGPIIPSTPPATTHLVSFLLELFPLIRRENLLQSFVSLPPDFANARFGFFSQRLQLLPGVSEYLMYLGFLIRCESKRI